MSSLVQNPDLRLVQTLTGLAAHHGKTYCIPNQQTILHLMKQHTGRHMATRTLNRHLGALERDGWLERVRRHKRGRTGALELHSTLYRLKRRCLAWVAKTAVTAAKLLRRFAQVLDLSAVPLLAQSENPYVETSTPAAKNQPPPEFKSLVERLRRANPKAKPL